MAEKKYEIERDEWLYVRADTVEAARRFFGAPPNHPAKFDRFDQQRPGRIFKVLAAGL